mmetsp:Transcript_835/g.1852  ORF Transcript_835/g.1852 Transcript_835/m.1852 type:complete len:118 (-) Transcript_835:546-899(-)
MQQQHRRNGADDGFHTTNICKPSKQFQRCLSKSHHMSVGMSSQTVTFFGWWAMKADRQDAKETSDATHGPKNFRVRKSHIAVSSEADESHKLSSLDQVWHTRPTPTQKSKSSEKLPS